MKAISFVTCTVVLCVSTIALAQSEMHKPDGQQPDAQGAAAQLAFARLKTLAGNWKGQAAMGPQPGMNAPVRVSLRVTSGGAALMHEMVPEGRSNDPSNGDDDPITMLYVDGGRLVLTHYCDSGKNRPRMVGKLSPGGKRVEFDFLDVSGGTSNGYMHHAVFTIVDADHHTEDWTYVSPADKPGQAHIDLVRAK
ncbi:MAG TPA: hypothetical protein VN924_03600 [Bryobacteraceae bacterium]|jgi:hypothetical protein|nr:hypothetical protein [Bryobacteraceae bacterium]